MEREHKVEWQSLCSEADIDPAEVRLVFERFVAYRSYTGQGTGQAIDLDQWFRFYHREKSSEGIQAGAPPPGGCSADGEAVKNACLIKPAEFLRVLTAYAESGDAAR